MKKMNKKGKIIGLSLVAIMVVSLFAVAIPSITANNADKPDLVITGTWVVGNKIHYTIENIGTADAPRSYTGLWIDEHYSARDRVDPLAPGEESDEEFARENYKGGEIRVCADYQDRIEEEDEENNCRVGLLPDLIIIEKEENLDADACTFTVTYTVKNVGNCKAGASTTTTTVGLVDDDFATPALDPGAEIEQTTATAFDCDPAGSEITVTADSAGVVDECDEDNNEFWNEFLCCPDLIITEKEETLDAATCTFTVTYTVKNVGNCKAGASTTTTTVGLVDDDFATPALDPGAEIEQTTATAFDCDPAGSEITVTADSAGVVDECDEDNNEFWNEFLCCPDLIITNKHETLDVATCTFTVTYTVKNVGNCTAGASITRTTVGVVTDNYETPALAPGAEDTHTTATGFNCVPGGVEVTVTADIDDDVWECTEDNNEVTNTYYCCPDLIITEKEETVNPEDCTFTVTYTVKNIGNCTADESITRTTVGLVDDDFVTPELDPEEEVEHTTVTVFDCDPDESEITVTADIDDDVYECDETNNDLVNEFLCCPDLIITEKEETVNPEDCTFTVTYTVKNIGNCTADESITRTTVGLVNDDFVTPELDPEEEVEHTTTTAFDCDPDESEITVTADFDDNVDECDETNNDLVNEFLCCPDLIITEKEETVNPEDCTFTVTYTVKNIGNCTADESITRTTVGLVDDDFVTPELDPEEEVEHTTTTAFDCDPDESEITVTADFDDNVDECDETNNDLVNEFLCCPDLIITEKEETVNPEDCTFTVTYTVKNIGNCTADESITRTTVDGVNDDFATPELDPEEEIEHTTATAFDCVPGGVEVTVTADFDDNVDECDEGNNEMTNIAICLCEPDLVITDIWVDGNRIHYTIENIGGEPAPRSYTGLWIDGKYSARDRVDPLEPGEELEEEFERENYKGGEIRVCADYQDRIEEANEENNCREEGPL